MAKKTLEQKINQMSEICGSKDVFEFLNDVIPLLELYDVDEEEDWVKDVVGEKDKRNVRLIRTFYLMSKIAENHAGKLCSIKVRHPKLWQEMQSLVEVKK